MPVGRLQPFLTERSDKESLRQAAHPEFRRDSFRLLARDCPSSEDLTALKLLSIRYDEVANIILAQGYQMPVSMKAATSYVNEVVNWLTLGAIGKHRAVRSAYFWIVAVPIFARLLSRLNEEFPIRCFGAELDVTLALPFSWKVFYFSSVFIAIGTTVYAIWCPAIVKQFRDFSEFESDGKSQYLLIEAMTLHPGRGDKDRFRERFCWQPDPYDQTIPTRERDYDHIEDRYFADAFHFARNAVSRWYPVARWICGAMYAVGFSLLGWVFVSTFLFVVRFATER